MVNIQIWSEVVRDVIAAKAPGFAEWYIDDIFINTAGIAGCEMIRRTVGLAHVAELDNIEDEAMQESTRKMNVLLGKAFIINRDSMRTGQAFLDTVKKFL